MYLLRLPTLRINVSVARVEGRIKGLKSKIRRERSMQFVGFTIATYSLRVSHPLLWLGSGLRASLFTYIICPLFIST